MRALILAVLFLALVSFGQAQTPTVILEWDAPIGDCLPDTYVMYWAPDGTPWVVAGEVPSTQLTFAHTVTLNGQRYASYRVTAKNAVGESEPSNIVQIPFVAGDIPRSLTYSSGQLRWLAPILDTPFDSYVVLQSLDGQATWTEAGKVPNTQTSWTVVQPPGVKYLHFAIATENRIGQSPGSAALLVPFAAPGVPLNLRQGTAGE